MRTIELVRENKKVLDFERSINVRINVYYFYYFVNTAVACSFVWHLWCQLWHLLVRIKPLRKENASWKRTFYYRKSNDWFFSHRRQEIRLYCECLEQRVQLQIISQGDVIMERRSDQIDWKNYGHEMNVKYWE